MKRLLTILGCAMLASFALMHPGLAWSKSAMKPPVKKAMVPKSKEHYRNNATSAINAVIPVVASAPEPIIPVNTTVTTAVPTGTTARVETVSTIQPPSGNPYLAHPQQVAQVDPWNNMDKIFDNVKSVLPTMPFEGQAILPKIQKVYPTGEKPLVVLTFKCPTELVGITPLPTKALHELVNLGMDAVNRTNLLSFNMQQVCQ